MDQTNNPQRHELSPDEVAREIARLDVVPAPLTAPEARAAEPMPEAEAPALSIAEQLAAPQVEPPPSVFAAPHSPEPPPPFLMQPEEAHASPERHPLLGDVSSYKRYGLMAASLALAAGIGAAATAGFSSPAKVASPAAAATKPAVVATAPAPQPSSLQRSDIAEETKAIKDALAQVRAGIKSLSDSVSTLRANMDATTKTTAKIGEVVDRLERSQTEPAQRLAKVTETLERLERRAANMAGVEVTGSVPTPPPRPNFAPPAPVAAVAPKPPAAGVVEGWSVRRVIDGVAILDGRDRTIEVEAGDSIRGVGRVQDIRRQNGRWVVVTSAGLILSR